MATLFKREGGTNWYVDYRYQGRRYKRSTKTNDRKLAELALKDIEVKIARNELGFDQGIKKIRLSEYVDKYLRFSKATKAYNTYCVDERVLRQLRANVNDMWLDCITPENVEFYKIQRLKVIKPSSVNVELKHLRSAFEKAKQWGFIK